MTGGDSPRWIKLFGELEKAGTFLAHSFVFCEGERSRVDKASSSGDVTPTGFPFEGGPTGFIFGDWSWFATPADNFTLLEFETLAALSGIQPQD